MKRALMVTKVVLCSSFSLPSSGLAVCCFVLVLPFPVLLHWQLRRCCVFPFHPAVLRKKVFRFSQWHVHGPFCRVCRGLGGASSEHHSRLCSWI